MHQHLEIDRRQFLGSASALTLALVLPGREGRAATAATTAVNAWLTIGSDDGISLTIGEVREREFCVHLIPETLARTNLGWVRAGWPTNIEIDPQTQAIVDTVERVLAARGGN